jgi:hypothetical protein
MNDPWDPIVKFVLFATALYLFGHIVFALNNF